MSGHIYNYLASYMASWLLAYNNYYYMAQKISMKFYFMVLQLMAEL